MPRHKKRLSPAYNIPTYNVLRIHRNWRCPNTLGRAACHGARACSLQVKVGRVTPAAHPTAVRAVWDMIGGAGGANGQLEERYEMTHAVLTRHSHRALQFSNRKQDLDTKYEGLHTAASAHPFDLDLSSTPHAQWREEIARCVAHHSRRLPDSASLVKCYTPWGVRKERSSVRWTQGRC